MIEPRQADTIDGVALAVFHCRLQGIVDKMQNTLFRTGRSGVLNTGHDFSCCIVTASEELLVAGDSLPIHVMSGPDLMAAAMRRFHPELHRGDAFLHNSPYHGNSHPADHAILVPVIDDEGRHRFTVLAKAHQADCGNAEPTTYAVAARDVYEEGALIFPAVRVQEDYRDRDDIIRICEARIRIPEQWRGDYLALLGAARIGERELLALGKEQGWDRLDELTRQWLDYSENGMVKALRAMPSGRASGHTRHDPFPGAPDGVGIEARVHLDAEAGRIAIDLRHNPDCLPSGLNLSEACARTAAYLGVFNSLADEPPPPNAGSFRRIEVMLRENCVVGIPIHPISCSAATTNLADRVTNAVQGAVAALGGAGGMAEAAFLIPPSDGVISGRDPRTGGTPFVNQLIRGLAGGPAGHWGDGWLTFGHPGSAGLCRWDSVEIDELMHPVVIREVRLAADSGGPGRHRGAPGCRVEFGPLDCGLSVMYAHDGGKYPPRGIRSGLAGGQSSQFVRRASGALEKAPAWGRVDLSEGESIVSVSCGGGGYGPPTEREADRVAADVAEGWVSAEVAAQVYGVVLDVTGGVDDAKTRRRREAMAAAATTAAMPRDRP
ncbi:MAG: hydantoinase B/oxoprolinase family protein [Alphaproteobacteria bacterium]|jgi:N-methylhydantoinase B|nr:hydantoinase B/oxoprolinase family protein [Alphaproteobacteria bacterium]